MQTRKLAAATSAAIALAICGPAASQERHDATTFAYGKVGATGLAAGLGWVANDQFALRLGAAGGAEYKGKYRANGGDYGVKRKFDRSLEAFADWYPSPGNGFRLTAGVLISDAKSSLSGRTNRDGHYVINNTAYITSSVGDLSGTMRHNRVAPYLGLGWESAHPGQRGWRFVSDAGFHYFGNARTSLHASGAATNAGLRQDLEADRRRLDSRQRNAISAALSVGAAYSF